MSYSINTDFTRGNCIVDKIVNDRVYIRPDMRDSGGGVVLLGVLRDRCAGKNIDL